MKASSQPIWLALLLVLGVACMLMAACHGSGAPAVPTETSTPPRPQIDTPFGRLEVAAANVVAKYPRNCVSYGCSEAKRGYKLLVVKLNVVERANGDDQDKPDSLCQGAYVATADGTRGECAISSYTVTLLQGSFFELVFTPPRGAEGFTLHVPGNEPVVLPTPSAPATPTP